MNKTLNKLKLLLSIAKNKFGKVATDKAEVFYDGEELKVETRVYDAEGNAIPDGEYSDGSKVYVIADSVVTEIRPVEEEKVEEEKTETTTTTETTEEKTEEMAEDDIVEETTEEIVEETIAPEAPSMEERVAALEKVVEELYEEIREMKVHEVERVAKNEEIIREFSTMRSTPSAKSVTASSNQESKEFACDGKRKLEKLKELKAKKQQ